MDKIYKGESLNLLFRCKDKEGNPVDMAGKKIAVVLRDSFGEIVCRFSNQSASGVKPAGVSGNVVLCRLSKAETSSLCGKYALEVKVTEGDLVMIDVLKYIRIHYSAIGEEVKL